MNRKIIYILSAFMLVFQSCNSYLDIQPKGYTIPSKYEDFRQLMNYSQMYKAADNYPVFITDDVLMGGEGSQRNWIDIRDTECKNLYTFEHGDIFADGEDDGLWNGSFSRIYTYNTVIENVMTSEGGKERDKKALLAEAKVARAFEYLVMIGCYAPAYDKNTASKDFGLPIITKTDVSDLSYTRASVEDIYDFIKKDLVEAIPDLYDEVPHSFRAAKSTAFGFFARMYLMRGEYDKALENAAQALKVNKSLVNLTSYMAKPNVSIGRIVDINTGKPYPEGKDNPENIYARYAPTVFGLQTSMFASTDLLNLYKKDLPEGAIDKRRELWFSDDKFNTEIECKGYSVFCAYIRQNLGLNNMEVILTAAECYARRGTADDLVEAANLYNYLRDNRILNNSHVSFVNANEALTKILDERRRELTMLGTNRLVDLKRLNKDPRFAKTVVHTDGLPGTKQWTLEPNDPRYIFPLPPKVKSFKPDLPDYTR